MIEHKAFTMSMFAKKEDLYKAKAEYYESVAREAEVSLEKIANILNHGGLIGFKTEDESLREVRRLALKWWNVDECDYLQQGL